MKREDGCDAGEWEPFGEGGPAVAQAPDDAGDARSLVALDECGGAHAVGVNFVDVADAQPLDVDEHGATQPVLEQQVAVHTGNFQRRRRLCSLAQSPGRTRRLTLPRCPPIRAEIKTRRKGVDGELLPQRLVPRHDVQLLAAAAQALERRSVETLHYLQHRFIGKASHAAQARVTPASCRTLPVGDDEVAPRFEAQGVASSAAQGVRHARQVGKALKEQDA
jgi:hypothetical protein